MLKRVSSHQESMLNFHPLSAGGRFFLCMCVKHRIVHCDISALEVRGHQKAAVVDSTDKDEPTFDKKGLSLHVPMYF